MSGRVARRAAVEAARGSGTNAICALCTRPLGKRIERHHLVPKNVGGRETVPLHPICHHTIHACCTNAELARHHVTMTSLSAREDIARFLRWIADKPPDFNAPTRRARSQS